MHSTLLRTMGLFSATYWVRSRKTKSTLCTLVRKFTIGPFGREEEKPIGLFWMLEVQDDSRTAIVLARARPQAGDRNPSLPWETPIVFEKGGHEHSKYYMRENFSQAEAENYASFIKSLPETSPYHDPTAYVVPYKPSWKERLEKFNHRTKIPHGCA